MAYIVKSSHLYVFLYGQFVLNFCICQDIVAMHVNVLGYCQYEGRSDIEPERTGS